MLSMSHLFYALAVNNPTLNKHAPRVPGFKSRPAFHRSMRTPYHKTLRLQCNYCV